MITFSQFISKRISMDASKVIKKQNRKLRRKAFGMIAQFDSEFDGIDPKSIDTPFGINVRSDRFLAFVK